MWNRPDYQLPVESVEFHNGYSLTIISQPDSMKGFLFPHSGHRAAVEGNSAPQQIHRVICKQLARLPLRWVMWILPFPRNTAIINSPMAIKRKGRTARRLIIKAASKPMPTSVNNKPTTRALTPCIFNFYPTPPSTCRYSLYSPVIYFLTFKTISDLRERCCRAS